MSNELVGWQFRYVFHDQDNRRSDWSGVLTSRRAMENGTKHFSGDKHHFEVRDVFAGPVGGGPLVRSHDEALWLETAMNLIHDMADDHVIRAHLMKRPVVLEKS